MNLKTERVWRRDYTSHGEATDAIANFIVSFYDSVRLDSKLGNSPPDAFELKSAINRPVVVCEKT